MAICDILLMDVDADDEDWIEIHNDTAFPVNLAGWFFTRQYHRHHDHEPLQ